MVEGVASHCSCVLGHSGHVRIHQAELLRLLLVDLRNDCGLRPSPWNLRHGLEDRQTWVTGATRLPDRLHCDPWLFKAGLGSGEPTLPNEQRQQFGDTARRV